MPKKESTVSSSARVGFVRSRVGDKVCGSGGGAIDMKGMESRCDAASDAHALFTRIFSSLLIQ